MADTISYVEKTWRSETESEALRFLDSLETSDSKAKDLVSNKAELKKMLTVESADERIKIANAFAKEAKSDLGLAHLILARESSALAEKEKHYSKAQENSKGHEYQTEHGIPWKADTIQAAITLEFADVLWRMSKPEAAIDVLKSLHSSMDSLWLSQDFIDYTVHALAAHLICQGKDKEARALLDEEPVPTAEWFYLNALLRFRESGDCIQSRSALSAGLDESHDIAITLADSEVDPDEQEQEDESKADVFYALITQPAWKKIEGSLPWLSKAMDNRHILFGESENLDEGRLKKWQREIELANTHLRREDFKSTKKSFKTALREADSLNDGGAIFLLTAQMLGAILQEAGDSLEDLRVIFDKKIMWLDQQESDDTESLFTSFLEFAKVLQLLAMDERAGHCAQKALPFYEKSIAKGTDRLDSFQQAECLFIYACTLSQDEKFAEAERCFSQLTSIQEEYLGAKHLSLVDSLMGWRYCLHKMGRHEEESVVYDRLYAIDENFDVDDEERFKCDAALVKAE